MLLQAKNIFAGYGAARVLQDVSLGVDSGEIVGIIGANGAGKTTLLRTISGLLRVQSGSISFEDQDITGWPAHRIARLGIAHVPEGRRLFGPLSVYDNLRCGLYVRLNEFDRQRKEELFDTVFDLFPILRERRRQQAATLSGGEQQMLALGRALMSAPRLLLVDEPSLGLAPIMVESVGVALRNINQKGITIGLVEQNSRIALSLASRIYVFEEGRIAVEGSSQELAADPRIKRIYLG